LFLLKQHGAGSSGTLQGIQACTQTSKSSNKRKKDQESVMSRTIKTITTLASAAFVLAATLSAADAKGGGGGGGRGGHGGGGGGGMRMSIGGGGGGHHHHHHRRFHFVTPVTPRVVEPVAVRRVAAPVPVAATPAAVTKIADSNGRTFDVASKVWFDGVDRCWSGKKAFSLKGGVWFYGDAKWYEQDGTWRTDAADGPTPVDCKAVPAFAARKPSEPGQQKVAGSADIEKERTGDAEPGKVQVGQTNEGPGARATECKKYFPSVGETLPVPCT
jgi:hypothetical protein